jgi:teichuronic acid biosynthesis glycosyltransferase TuaG
MPMFNSEAYISESINSVINQSYTNWELLLVDDGSTDKTVDIIKEFIKRDNRIKFYALKLNSGPAVARNIGIKEAKGKYLTFLDADDVWFNNFIESSIETIKNTKVPFVFSSYKRSDETLNCIYSDFIVPQKVSYEDILKTNSISCLTAFLDIEKLGKKSMPLIKKRQDMGLWLKYLKEIPFAYGVQDTKAIYRIRKNSLSRKKTDLIKYQWQFYREVEKLNVWKSMYYMFYWTINGLKKYRA